MEKQLQGLALILFGILLGLCGETVNQTLLSNLSDFPFALLGLVAGTIGLVLAFKKAGGKR